MTFLATWRCASDFLDMLSKFNILKLVAGAKNLKLKVRNYSNFTSTFPTICRCAGDFFQVLLKFEMAATDQLEFFFGGGGGRGGYAKLKKII